MRRAPLLGLATAGLLFVGCGGGGGGKTGTPVTVYLAVTPELGGSVDSDAVVDHGLIRVGDTSSFIATAPSVRGFVSFDLSPIPPGAFVTSATLSVWQAAVFGTPYATLGSVVVDQAEWGAVLDAGAYSRTFLAHQGFAALSADASIGARSVDATAEVQGDLVAARGRSQFRLRFQVENDGGVSTDEVRFSPPNGPPTGADPLLVVTYLP